MNQASNISLSISLVRKELETTLQKAEGYFSQYSESQEPSLLKLFADEVNLARGTFKLLELSGAEALSTEMLSLFGDGTAKMELKLEALGRALLGLNHYISLLLNSEKDHPILLIPAINLVRKAGGHKPLSESHFFKVNLRPKLPPIEKTNLNIKPHLARVRLMYQAGLLRVLRGTEPAIGLKLIQRSLVLLERGFRGSIAWSFWWTCKAAVDVMVTEEYELTLARRMLFGRIDIVMRNMIKEGGGIFTAQAANELQKDLLQLISLSQSEDANITLIKKTFLLKAEVFEQDLKAERSSLAGPNIEAYESLSKAFKEEIQVIKNALDVAAKGALPAEDYTDLSARMNRLANVLSVINQEPLSKTLKKQHDNLLALSSLDGEKQVTALAHIADALLQVELASAEFVKGSVRSTDNEKIIGAGHYFEARIILFDEVESGIAMAKRAIASYMDAHDKLHLSNVSLSLQGVKGGLIFLMENRAAQVIASVITYLEKHVVNSQEIVSDAKLEVLADALTSIEYHCETLSQSGAASKDILELAVKSMGQLGFKIQ